MCSFRWYQTSRKSNACPCSAGGQRCTLSKVLSQQKFDVRFPLQNLKSKMATSNVVKSCATKLTKAEKKALRKQTKVVNSLRRHNADLASVSETPTRHLMIGNGGLMCGVQRSQVVSLFQKFGNIERILMFPGRSFSFLSFENVSGSMKAMDTVHGRVLDCPSEFPRPDVTFYLSFLGSVPCDVTIEKQVKPTGLVLVEGFVSDAEEEELIQALGWGSESNDSELQGTGICKQVFRDFKQQEF